MKVEELVDTLLTMDQDAHVRVWNMDRGEYVIIDVDEDDFGVLIEIG